MVKPIKENLPLDKPFLLLEGLSKDFMIAKGMNTQYPHICPRCGRALTHTTRVVYVAVEDKVMCVGCADHWITYTRWYSEDVKKEEENYKAMIQKLKDSKLWQE